MTPDECSTRPMVKQLEDRSATARAAMAVGAPALRPGSKVQVIRSDPRPAGVPNGAQPLLRTPKTETDQESGPIQRP